MLFQLYICTFSVTAQASARMATQDRFKADPSWGERCDVKRFTGRLGELLVINYIKLFNYYYYYIIILCIHMYIIYMYIIYIYIHMYYCDYCYESFLLFCFNGVLWPSSLFNMSFCNPPIHPITFLLFTMIPLLCSGSPFSHSLFFRCLVSQWSGVSRLDDV